MHVSFTNYFGTIVQTNFTLAFNQNYDVMTLKNRVLSEYQCKTDNFLCMPITVFMLFVIGFVYSNPDPIIIVFNFFCFFLSYLSFVVKNKHEQ